MNRADARKIAETITNEQIQEMFCNAKEGIHDWTKVSECNKSCTKGVAWNILASKFDINYKYHILAKTNFVREFGEFLSNDVKPIKVVRKVPTPIHQNPQF